MSRRILSESMRFYGRFLCRSSAMILKTSFIINGLHRRNSALAPHFQGRLRRHFPHPSSTVFLKASLILNGLQRHNSALALHFQGRLRRHFPHCRCSATLTAQLAQPGHGLVMPSKLAAGHGVSPINPSFVWFGCWGFQSQQLGLELADALAGLDQLLQKGFALGLHLVDGVVLGAIGDLQVEVLFPKFGHVVRVWIGSRCAA